MIETSALLHAGMPVTLRCGSIVADAIVVWSEGTQTGVNFAVPLSDRDLAEQLARTAAISSRRQPASQNSLPSLGRSAADQQRHSTSVNSMFATSLKTSLRTID